MLKSLVSKEKGARTAIIAGFLTLITSAFLDNFRGPLLPVVQAEFELSYDSASWFLIVGNLFGVLASLVIVPLLNRYSEKRLLLCAGMWTVGVVLYTPLINSFNSLMFFSAGLGISVALLGTLCNILTISGARPGQESRLVALLHVMYGVGSMLGPIALVQVREEFGWRYSSYVVFPFLVSIVGLILISKVSAAKFQRKAKTVDLDVAVAELPVTSSAEIPRFLPDSTQVLMLLTFMFYVGAEVMTSMWMPALLTERFHYSIDAAASMAAYFFAILAGIRVICFFILRPSLEKPLLWAGLLAPLGAILGAYVFNAPILLPLTGFFGPFFPIYFVRVSKSYPEKWKQMSTWLIVALQLSLALCHFGLGKLTNHLSIGHAYLVIPCLILLSMVFLKILESKNRNFYSTDEVKL